MSIRALRDAENVFRIEKRCKLCEQAPLSCEGITCPANQVCVQNSRTCDECASVNCQIDPTAGPSAPSKPNAGAIAGGVIGGVAFIAILTFVVWKYCLKGKRRPASQQGDWQEVDVAQREKDQNDFQSRRSARASTHTVASMASSVLTRASNIIQIAYIPGVTNRSGPGSPDVLVPPVPPIPAMTPSSGASTPYSTADQHFFVPDFRDSMMSSSTAGRTSIAPSLAQRGSVASTMYRQNAIVSPLPAQTIVRGKAAVVSVKSNGTNSPAETPGAETPPVPQIDPKHAVKPIRIHMPGISPANSVRSTAQLGPVKALTLTKKKSSDTTPPKSAAGSLTSGERTLVNTPEVLVPSARPLTGYSATSSEDGGAHSRARRGSLASDSDDSDDDHARAKQTLRMNSPSDRDSELTEFQDTTPTMDRSPFTDSSSLEPPRPMMSQRITSYDTSLGLRTPMTPIVEEASAPKRDSTVSRRDPSPFSDNNQSEL
ncbi:membrane anchor opy2 protein [Stemphylium lycopersici]|uniref:Membrane anchor opy2 protein n=1 Tax=Stemphylium lycopersici TaxID=183478 RepID=A0A364N9U9_STELY|nr:membrane anchor opy2 protein [Stemphylium lycopersici]RAR11238.1 membrane anchor opy2 protein [Stemphylium lycopersici]RAR13943.1 membrane anchor opy2 protein [Stemphylium lycopersici]